MVGQAVGARRDRMVVGIAVRALLLGGGYALVWTFGLAFGAELFVRAFTDDPVLIAAAVPLFWVAAGFQVLDAANVCARSTLQGTGDVRFPAAVGIVTAWILTPPATYFLGWQLGLGALGGWLGIAGEIAIGALIFWARVLRGGWRPAAERTRAEVASDPLEGDEAPDEPRPVRATA